MKYQMSVLIIVCTGQLLAIDLSGLVSAQGTQVVKKDFVQKKQSNSQDAPSVSLSDLTTGGTTPVVAKKQQIHGTDLSTLASSSDPEYQQAMDILNDPENLEIYDDYLKSIREYFMDYYLTHVQSVKKIVRKPPVIDLSGLENLSSQPAIKVKAQQLPKVDLSSLTDMAGVKVAKVPKKLVHMDLGTLVSAANVSVQKIKPVQKPVVDLSALQNTAEAVVQKAQVKQRGSVDLSALIDEQK